VCRSSSSLSTRPVERCSCLVRRTQGLGIGAFHVQVSPPFGQDLENNIIYVWPYLAEVELDKLTPAQEVDLLRLVGAAEAKAMREKKKWTWWRLTIGADGTWHSFKKAD